MSYTNGFQTLVQSMNGLLTFNDGAGTVIENGNITTNSLSLNNIYATITNTSVSLWSNFTTGTVYLMTGMTTGAVNVATALSAGNAGVLYLGNELCTIVLGIFFIVGNSVQLGLGSTVNLFTNMVAGDICSIGSSVNTNNIGGIEIINRGINSKIKTANLSIGQLLTTGIVQIGSSVISVVVGSFTFLGTSIQAGTSGTINLFTNLTGTSTINFGTNITTGTLNIGKGGNINIGSATTGSLIKIDQNGLDTQVIIAPQQNASGSVTIGSTTNTNRIGNLRIIGSSIIPNTSGQTMSVGTGNTTTMNIGTNTTTATLGGVTCNIGSQNAGINNKTVNIGTVGLNTGSNYVNIGLTNTNTTINGGGVTLTNNTVGGYTYGSQVRITSGAENIEMDFRGASTTLNNTYDTRIKSFNGTPWTAQGQGLQQFFGGQQEMLYSASFAPRALNTYYGGGMCYYQGGVGIENSFTISGYAPFGGVRLGGCGISNAYYPNTWTEAFVAYPGYGSRFKNGGISFDKGSLNPGTRGWVPTCGVKPLTNSPLPAGTNVQQAVSFGTTFSANPYVTATILIETINTPVDSLLITVYGISTTGFNVNIKNTSGLSTGSSRWGYHWIAWGPY